MDSEGIFHFPATPIHKLACDFRASEYLDFQIKGLELRCEIVSISLVIVWSV